MIDEHPSRAARILSGSGAEVWSTGWVAAWYAATLTWIVYGLWTADFSRGASSFVVLFFPLELWGLRQKNDAYPPLTHVIRNRFPSWFAFPLIFGTIAAVSARWANLDWRPVALITLPVAAGGWLIEHFLATYDEDDPRPYREDRHRRAA